MQNTISKFQALRTRIENAVHRSNEAPSERAAELLHATWLFWRAEAKKVIDPAYTSEHHRQLEQQFYPLVIEYLQPLANLLLQPSGDMSAAHQLSQHQQEKIRKLFTDCLTAPLERRLDRLSFVNFLTGFCSKEEEGQIRDARVIRACQAARLIIQILWPLVPSKSLGDLRGRRSSPPKLSITINPSPSIPPQGDHTRPMSASHLSASSARSFFPSPLSPTVGLVDHTSPYGTHYNSRLPSPGLESSHHVARPRPKGWYMTPPKAVSIACPQDCPKPMMPGGWAGACVLHTQYQCSFGERRDDHQSIDWLPPMHITKYNKASKTFKLSVTAIDHHITMSIDAKEDSAWWLTPEPLQGPEANLHTSAGFRLLFKQKTRCIWALRDDHPGAFQGHS